MPEEGSVSELEVAETVQVPADNDCLFCETMIQWLREAWPVEHIAELPEFLPRKRKPMVRIHNEQADAMPFCEICSKMYMAILGQFHLERQQREGQEPTALRARVEQQLVTPKKQLLLPGMPGFKSP